MNMISNLKKSSLTKTVIASAVFFALAGCSATTAENNTSNTSNSIVSASNKLSYVRNVEGIDEYVLENGMKVLLYPDPAQPKTLVNITYKVGSVHENYGETGMAHLLEHMLFKGSTNYKDIDKQFNTRGMRVNATTWLDRTNYFELFDYDEENLEWALGMEADRMVNATFTADELESEMTVVRNEMERGENNPYRMLMSRMSSAAYLWHNYANSTIGARSDVENFPFPKLRQFYKKHYRPDNAVLTVAGRFNKEKTIELIEKKFGVLAKPATQIEKLYTVEPTQDGEREVNLRRVGDVPVIAAQYHVPSALHEDTPAVQVLTEILKDGARGRLQKKLVEKGLASGMWAGSYLRKDPSNLLVLGIGFKDKDTEAMESELINIVESISSDKITEQEVAQAKTSILKNTEDKLRNVTSVGMQLSEFIAMGDYRYIFYFRDLVEKVTLADVQRVAEQYLVKSNRTIGRFIPTKEPKRAEITPAKDISELLATYKGREAVEAGEVYDNNVENIKARLQEFKWQAGTTVSVYPKKLRGGEVRLSMSFPTGSADSLADYVHDFKLMGGLFYSGSAKYSKEEIATKLDELKASISISTSTVGEVNVQVKAVKENLTETINLLAELLANPKFDESEIELDRKATITGLESERNDPKSIAASVFNKIMNGHEKGHPLAHLTVDEEIAGYNKVTQSRLKNLHKSHLTVANGHIGVVGDVKARDVSLLLEKALSDLQGNAKYQEMEPVRNDVEGSENWVETPDKANSQLYIGHVIELNKQHPDYHAAFIANQIFGGSGFASRLMQRIRVKEGYSYGTYSALKVEYDKQHGIYFMGAIAAPENMKKVVAAYKEEVQKVLDNGFTQKEMDDAISGAIKKFKASWANEAGIAAMLASNQELGRELDWFTEYEQKFSTLTLEQVNAAFAKYMAREELNVFAAGDFAKTKE